MGAATAVILAMIADLSALGHRLAAAPDVWLAVTGSALTAILAPFAAFQLSLPDSRRAWALLPVPATLLWIVARGFCGLRVWSCPRSHPPHPTPAPDSLISLPHLPPTPSPF